MTERSDVQELIKEFPLKLVFDSRKSQAYVQDTTCTSINVFFREIGKADTDEYLSIMFEQRYGYYPSDSSIKTINKSVMYKSKSSDNKYSINIRVEKKDNIIYVNNGSGSIIKITDKKVQLVDKCKVKFEVNNNIGKIVDPDLDNRDLDLLKKYINVKPSDFKLILVYIFNCFFTDTNYVMLALIGPAGSAKSFITTVIKTIIDPSDITLRNQFSKTEDLVIAAAHCHLIDINNVSRISDKIQDALCTILTGGVKTARTKYSDSDETAIHTHNPVIINGIGDIISRDDIYDRSIVVRLKKISESKNIVPIGERQLKQNFLDDLPSIMGGIFNALSDILAVYESIDIPDKLNRMADFHILGLAVEKALGWANGSFTKAYDANISEIQTEVLEDSKLALALIKLKKRAKSNFVGSYSELKVRLKSCGYSDDISPRRLRADLDRISASLSNLHGIDIANLNRSNAGSRVGVFFIFKKYLSRYCIRLTACQTYIFHAIKL